MEFPMVAEDISSREGTCSTVLVWDFTAGLFSLHLALLSLSKQAEQSTKQFSAQVFTDLGFPAFVKPWGLRLGFLKVQGKVFSEVMSRESDNVLFFPLSSFNSLIPTC